VEKKYLLTKEQYNQLLNRIEPFMLRDKYGLHTICNIYYDTDNYDLIRISSERPIYKEKLRLRSYGIPSEEDTVFLEIKKKYKGTVYKRRISLRLKDAVNYLEHGIKPCCDNQILHEIDYFIDYYKPSGKVFIAYDRTAFYGREDASIRITFDQNIRSRTYDLDLSKGDTDSPSSRLLII
jgi:SPX domain protein involved in polyphosphate accumulation